MTKSKQTKKPAQQKPSNELSDKALDKASGGSFSWGMQNTVAHDISIQPATDTNPGALLPAVQKTIG